MVEEQGWLHIAEQVQCDHTRHQTRRTGRALGYTRINIKMTTFPGVSLQVDERYPVEPLIMGTNT